MAAGSFVGAVGEPPPVGVRSLLLTVQGVGVAVAFAALPLDDPQAATDFATALLLLANLQTAQQTLGTGQTVGGTALAPHQGVVASSSVLNTGFGSSYYPNLHIGATGWAVIAAQFGNPFKLGESSL